MNLSFDGQLTKQNYIHAHRLHQQPSRLTRIIRISWVTVLLLILPAAFALDLALFQQLLPIDLFVLSLATMPWWLSLVQAEVAWRSQPALRQPMTGSVTAQGLHYQSIHATSEIAWPLFLKHKRSSEVVLLYQASNLFTIMPKTFFRSDAEWNAFVQLVDQHLPVVASGEKYQQRVWQFAFLAVLLGTLLVSVVTNLLQGRP